MVSAMANPNVRRLAERLAEILLGEPLDGWVRKQRARGHSWDRISRDLYESTEIEMNGNTLRVHYAASDRASA